MMRREGDDGFRGTRLSYAYYPVDSPELAGRMQRAMPYEGFYTHLLFQDLDHIVPYTIGRTEGVRARVVGAQTDRRTELVGEALSERGYPSLVDGARSFFLAPRRRSSLLKSVCMRSITSALWMRHKSRPPKGAA